jgi:DNA polymerase-3 subunit beta
MLAVGEDEAALDAFLGAFLATVLTNENAEEGEARETVETSFGGDDTDIGFNAQYLQDFLSVVGTDKVAFEFKDGNSQAQLKPASDDAHEYKYIVMPMRL